MTDKPEYIKEKYVSIAPEELVQLTPYAFTFNPVTEFTDVIQFRTTMHKLFREHCITNDIQHTGYKLFPEISKLGKLHLHGYVMTNNILNFYLKFILPLKHKGTFALKPLNEPIEWYTYVRKQSLMTFIIESPEHNELQFHTCLECYNNETDAHSQSSKMSVSHHAKAVIRGRQAHSRKL